MAQHILGQLIGFAANRPNVGHATLALSAANTWFAMSFIGNGKTLSTLDLYISALAGTLATTELTLDIYSTGTTGDPNASVSGPHNCGATPAVGWNQWSPAYATTDGTMYWAVVKNTNGTPGTNTPTFRYGAALNSLIQLGDGSNLFGWTKNHTTDASTWTNEVRGATGILLGWNDSTYDGTPFSNNASTAVGVGIYAARELGNTFVHAGPTLNVQGIAAYIGSVTGTPTNQPRARLYSGSSATPTLVATSSAVMAVGQVAAGWFYFPFAAAQTMAAGTHRIVIGTTGSDASGNRYNLNSYTIKNDANSKLLVPWGMKQTYTTDGTTFSETDTEIIPMGLVLSNNGEFTVSGGGGVLVPSLQGGIYQ